jgi:hypothetical protein
LWVEGNDKGSAACDALAAVFRWSATSGGQAHPVDLAQIQTRLAQNLANPGTTFCDPFPGHFHSDTIT